MKTTEVKETKGKGKGVFALRDFNEGEFILNLDGETWEKDSNEEYDERVDPPGGPIGRKKGKIVYLASKSNWVYINHSCSPNAGLVNDKDFVARKKIKKGEEITQDYSAIDIEGIKAGKKALGMSCNCGSENCRGEILSYDLLDKKTQENLRPFLTSTLVKFYNL